LLSDLIAMMSDAGVMSRMVMVSYALIRTQNGHVVAKKRINAVGIEDARPMRYNRFMFRLRSVSQPEGRASNVFTALLMLLIKPISTVDAPKRLTNTDQ
jgi:hypothetical protein